MSRWKAAAIHLSISVAIGLAAAALIFGVWYPAPYSQAAGAGELVLLLLGVDVVLGPLLTLVIFRSGKKGLKFDLAVIAVMQACALTYGLSVVTRARPAFIVAAVDRFTLVTANDLDAADLAQGSKPEFQSVSWTGPKLVGVEMPQDTKSHNDLVFSGAAGKDIEQFPKYYVDYAQTAKSMLARAKPLDVLRKVRPEAAPLLEDWLHGHNRDAATIAWLPLTTQTKSLVMLLDRTSGQVLDALPIDPW